MTIQHDHPATDETAGGQSDDMVTVRIPARAAAYIGAYLEESVSQGAIKVQRAFFWVLCSLALGFVLFGALDWAKSPSDDVWPFDTAMILGGALFIAAVFWVRRQSLRVWRRAGLL